MGGACGKQVGLIPFPSVILTLACRHRGEWYDTWKRWWRRGRCGRRLRSCRRTAPARWMLLRLPPRSRYSLAAWSSGMGRTRGRRGSRHLFSFARVRRCVVVCACQQLFKGTITTGQISQLVHGVDKDDSQSISGQELFAAVNRRTRADVRASSCWCPARAGVVTIAHTHVRLTRCHRRPVSCRRCRVSHLSLRRC